MTIEQRDKELNRILETFETHRLEIYRKLKDGSFAPDEAFDRVNSLRHETQQELVATTEQYAAKERSRLNLGGIEVMFSHTAVNDDMHMFINDSHDPSLCPECIKPGSLTTPDNRS